MNNKQKKTKMVTITDLPIESYNILKKEVLEIKGLESRKQTVPTMLKILAENFRRKVLSSRKKS